MTHIEELEKRFRDVQEDLARVDFDQQYIEGKLLYSEKGSLEYFHFFESLNSLEKKRQMVVSRLASLRIQIEREKKKEERRKELWMRDQL